MSEKRGYLYRLLSGKSDKEPKAPSPAASAPADKKPEVDPLRIKGALARREKEAGLNNGGKVMKFGNGGAVDRPMPRNQRGMEMRAAHAAAPALAVTPGVRPAMPAQSKMAAVPQTLPIASKPVLPVPQTGKPAGMKCGGKVKKMASGGGVRGCGAATKGHGKGSFK